MNEVINHQNSSLRDFPPRNWNPLKAVKLDIPLLAPHEGKIYISLFNLCSDNERKLENHDREASPPSPEKFTFSSRKTFLSTLTQKYFRAPLRQRFFLATRDKFEQLKTLLYLEQQEERIFCRCDDAKMSGVNAKCDGEAKQNFCEIVILISSHETEKSFWIIKLSFKECFSWSICCFVAPKRNF